MKLTFSFHNQKIKALANAIGCLKTQVVAFDLPAGYTCHNAHDCKTFANRANGKIIDNKIQGGFRCYASSVEGRYPSVRKMRWNNFTALRSLSLNEMVKLITDSLPEKVKVIRIHSSGDFFSMPYFMAWYNVARDNPKINFFSYTKILACVKFLNNNPLPNFKMVYSFGGLDDNNVESESVCKVVKSNSEAEELNIKVVCENNKVEDYFYIMENKSFALKIHGNQPNKG